MTMYQILKQTNMPVAYMKFNSPVNPPFLVYKNTGQEEFCADNKQYYKERTYRIEYYFTKKNEKKEDELEEFLQENNFNYTKSEDIYIQTEDMYVIYYEI